MSDIEPITAAGGVLFRENSSSVPQVVLIYRRGVWDLPKGKIETGETVEACAVREVAEELGLSELPSITDSLTKTYHEYEQNGICIGKTTHWYAMKYLRWSSEVFEPETKEGIEKAQWFALKDAIQKVGFENLVEVLDSFSEWYQTSTG